MPSVLCKRFWMMGVFVLLIGLIAGCGEADPVSWPPLLDRNELVAEPTRISPRLSPDGSMLAFLARGEAHRGLWIAPFSAPLKARLIHEPSDGDIVSFGWTHDAKYLVFAATSSQNEGLGLFAFEVPSARKNAADKQAAPRELLPAAARGLRLLGTFAPAPDEFLFTSFTGDGSSLQLTSVNLRSGLRTVIETYEGVHALHLDRQGRPVLAERQLSSGGFAWALRDGENGWSNIAEFAAEDRFDAGIDAISDDGRTAYARDPRGGNFAQLVSIDLVGGQIRTLANAAGRSIVASRSVGGNLPAIAYAIDPARRSWGSSDPALRRSLQDLSSKVEGDLDIIDTSVSGDIWLVAADQDRAGRTYFRYEREAGTVTRLFNDRPHLNAGKLLSLFPITLSARDGVTLPGYFTLPYQVAAGGDAAADQLPPAVVPVPLVVLVHGGPWARDHWGYHPIHQWLGNRGYAVMSINFRGSVGFGRAHHVRGAGEWGQAMQHDLYDAIAWAIERGYVDKDRVAFIGGSYGGYATVQALLDRQSPAACGVAVSAPVDLISLVESVPAWWASARQILNRNVGETSSAAFRETLRARSPLYSKQQIKGPLLMAHGSEDRRAYPSSIDAFARAQSAKTAPVTALLLEGAGHGFLADDDNQALFAVADTFLAACLAGRSQPLGADDLRALPRVLVGEDRIEGLASALATARAESLTSAHGTGGLNAAKNLLKKD